MIEAVIIAAIGTAAGAVLGFAVFSALILIGWAVNENS